MKSYEAVTNPQLVKAMDAFNLEKTIDTQKEFIKELRDAYLLVPIDVKGGIVEGNLTKEAELQIKLMSDSEGNLFYAVFTDWQELTRFTNKEEDAVVLSYEEIREIIKIDSEKIVGIVINPMKYDVDFILTENIMQDIDKKIDEL